MGPLIWDTNQASGQHRIMDASSDSWLRTGSVMGKAVVLQSRPQIGEI